MDPFTVIECGTIAAVAVGFGKYLGTFFPGISDTVWLGAHIHIDQINLFNFITLGPYDMGLTPSRLSGVVIIAFLSGINLLGVKAGSRIQNILTVVKIASLAVLIFGGFIHNLKSLRTQAHFRSPKTRSITGC